MAAMLGAVPLAIGFGEGAELRRPPGITIVGGLLVSQVLTLFRPHAIEQLIEKVGFAGDSPLEGAGSELPVPVEIRLRFQAFSGTGPPLGPAFVWISEASRANTRWTSS
jgi:hypothetical protein